MNTESNVAQLMQILITMKDDHEITPVASILFIGCMGSSWEQYRFFVIVTRCSFLYWHSVKQAIVHGPASDDTGQPTIVDVVQ